MVEEGWGDDGFLWGPRQDLARRRVALLIEARGLQASEAFKPPHQIVTKSGAMGHLDYEAVRDQVECFEMSTAMAIVLLVGYAG